MQETNADRIKQEPTIFKVNSVITLHNKMEYV
jgi:hypothetical protein